MEFPKIKKKWGIWGSIALLFILLNPSGKEFQEFKGTASYRGLHRRANLFFFSIYAYQPQDSDGSDDGQPEIYVGILSNFIGG